MRWKGGLWHVCIGMLSPVRRVAGVEHMRGQQVVAPATPPRSSGAAEVMSEITLRWEGKRGSGKYAMKQRPGVQLGHAQGDGWLR